MILWTLLACGDEDPTVVDAWIAANEPGRARTSKVSATAEFRCWRWDSEDGEGLSVATLDGEAITQVHSFLGPTGRGEHIDALRSYQAAWAEPDQALVHLEAGFAEDGRFVDPSSDVTGRAALAEHIQDTMSNPILGRFTFAEVGGMDVGEGVFRFHWSMDWRSGKTALTGLDYGRLDDDGKVQLLVGCWD